MENTQSGTGPRIHHLKALAAVEADRIPDAVAELRAALQLDPSLSPAWNDLGVLMEVLGNPSDAARCYRAAIACDPQAREAKDNLADLMMQLQMARILRKREEAMLGLAESA